MNDLVNLTMLVTRPEPEGGLLCKEVEAHGGSAVHLPTIEFAALESDHSFKPMVSMLDQYDWIIFISPRAVEYSLPLIRAKWPVFPTKPRIAAPGAGTAKALHAAGFADVIYPPHHWTSEGLLDLAALNQIDHRNILLIRGEGGRDMLAEALSARGAHVDHWPVYRRIVPVYANITAHLALLRQKKIDIMVCTSGESLHNLMTIIGIENQSLLSDVAIVVVSERLAILAENLHFKQVFIAENASNKAIIETLRYIKGKGYVR